MHKGSWHYKGIHLNILDFWLLFDILLFDKNVIFMFNYVWRCIFAFTFKKAGSSFHFSCKTKRLHFRLWRLWFMYNNVKLTMIYLNFDERLTDTADSGMHATVWAVFYLNSIDGSSELLGSHLSKLLLQHYDALFRHL